jgi:hypothetical protein
MAMRLRCVSDRSQGGLGTKGRAMKDRGSLVACPDHESPADPDTLENVHLWKDLGLWVGECKRCGSTLSARDATPEELTE